MDNEQIIKEYFQWLKDTGRMEYKLTDVFINDDEVLKVEEQMAWVINATPDDWKEFMKEEGRKKLIFYIGEFINL